MSLLTKTIASAALAAGVLAGGGAYAAPAGPGEINPKIAVPDRPNIAVPDRNFINGCYSITQRVYGPYRVSFCLNDQRGTYRVTGGGLDCRGGLSASRVGPLGVNISLRYAQCGRGMAWTADKISCRATPFPFPQRPFRQGGMQPNIAVPDFRGELRCTYDPAVRGYPTIQVRAARA
jgi:hypothetical protein